MNDLPILSVITFLPLMGAIFIWLIKGEEKTVAHNSKMVALWTSFVVFVLSVVLWWKFDPLQVEYQFIERFLWIPVFHIYYHMGVDGLSLLFVLLSAFLTPLCILASWESIRYRVREYMLAFLLLETLMIGMFCALDLFLFYVFFEGVLIPMFLIIGIWGGERRIYSCFKFFLYTFLGSVFMFISILTIYYETGSTDLNTVIEYTFPFHVQIWLWLAFFAAFAVKVPMWPVHTWLPDAHVEAPTAGSVILAGVLLKMGAYGFLRFSIPLFPSASVYFGPLVIGLSLVAIIYTSFVALVQKDVKKLIAYSSVAHMGIVTLGIFTLQAQAVAGAVLQMLSHGLVSAALFLCVGVIYDRFHTREIQYYGGLVNKMPLYATFFVVFTLASIGLPGTSGFIGEWLVFLGAFQWKPTVMFFAAFGMILGAGYALWLVKRIIFGKVSTQMNLKFFYDLHPREIIVLGSIMIMVLWMGIYPKTFLDTIYPSIRQLVHNHQVWEQGERMVYNPYTLWGDLM
ncbi:MAG: NADH-quinone oxidoreductase subunit M, partial [Proteobacteria bacterium]|nr:NADH-quinone oxidoreductase subunit M [Pseudomonadota bacterium]